MQQQFATLGVSPKLLDWWICKLGDSKYGIMIMEDAGETLWRFIDLDDDQITGLLDVLTLMVNQIHDEGFYHGDIAASNITLKRTDHIGDGFYVTLPNGPYRIYLIDTELSGVASENPYEVHLDDMQVMNIKLEFSDYKYDLLNY